MKAQWENLIWRSMPKPANLLEEEICVNSKNWFLQLENLSIIK